ncbi:MAG: GTPase HflX [Porticoccaceae bacterium]|nr:GTPase HflX [Porticoccaceae bacterium]
MFFDRPDSGERALLVQISVRSENRQVDPSEFSELVAAAGAEPVGFVEGTRDRPQAKFFVGTGKLEEIKNTACDLEAELVIFDHELSPSQERNLEKELECRVLNRTGLILDIFAQRARTHEGKLQVELAQLEHLSTRLIRGWTHLERQKGGIGLRGPGETQLETDRRLLRDRIKSITKRLDKVRTQREQGRRARRRAQLPVVSLVGYTNAGKSTLFNQLADAKVFAKDQLFATLDPTMRRIEIDGYGPLVLADTVGFISQLPHQLVEAFRATLEEAAQADLLLEVVDISAEDWRAQCDEVELVLEEIGADEIPKIRVFNKIDVLEDRSSGLDSSEDESEQTVWLSAKSGDGLDFLKVAIAKSLGTDRIQAWYRLPANHSRLISRLHAQSAIQEEKYGEDGSCELLISINRPDWQRILGSEGLSEESLAPLP